MISNSQHVYEVRPRKDKRSVDLISDALRFGSPLDNRLDSFLPQGNHRGSEMINPFNKESIFRLSARVADIKRGPRSPERENRHDLGDHRRFFVSREGRSALRCKSGVACRDSSSPCIGTSAAAARADRKGANQPVFAKATTFRGLRIKNPAQRLWMH